MEMEKLSAVKIEKSDSTILPNEISLPNEVFMHNIYYRTLGQKCRARKRTLEESASDFVGRKLPELLKEKQYDMKKMNKIFAAHWLTDKQIVFGTKCNKLVVLDLITKELTRIPSLYSGMDSLGSECPCGIHGISINPSRSLLATGGENVNDLAIYRLPTFDPVCVGEKGHSDWIFDIQWIDDEFVVTGSRDSNMSLWLVKDERSDSGEEVAGGSAAANCPRFSMPQYRRIRPSTTIRCQRAEKVRAFAYNSNTQDLAVLSLNAVLHLFDANKFMQKASCKLRHQKENVCLSVSEAHNLYAVGSQSFVTLLDSRLKINERIISSPQTKSGVRSLNFLGNMLTVGTGGGKIYFYDLRNEKFLVNQSTAAPFSLKMGPGYLEHDSTYREFFADYSMTYPNAVYVHRFNEDKTKLFAAGGPLPAGLWGNYAAIWQ